MVSARAHSVSNTSSDKCCSRSSSRCRGVKRLRERRGQSYFGGFARMTREGEEESASRPATAALTLLFRGGAPDAAVAPHSLLKQAGAHPSLHASLIFLASPILTLSARAARPCPGLPSFAESYSSSLAEPEHNAPSNRQAVRTLAQGEHAGGAGTETKARGAPRRSVMGTRCAAIRRSLFVHRSAHRCDANTMVVHQRVCARLQIMLVRCDRKGLAIGWVSLF